MENNKYTTTSTTSDTNTSDIKKVDQKNLKARRIIYYIFGVLEVLFVFRLIFKVLGADPGSTFVSLIYSVTNLFLAPFVGIFGTVKTEGIETQAVLEPTLIIAMVVYAAIAWGIITLIEINKKHRDSETL